MQCLVLNCRKVVLALPGCRCRISWHQRSRRLRPCQGASLAGPGRDAPTPDLTPSHAQPDPPRATPPTTHRAYDALMNAGACPVLAGRSPSRLAADKHSPVGSADASPGAISSAGSSLPASGSHLASRLMPARQLGDSVQSVQFRGCVRPTLVYRSIDRPASVACCLMPEDLLHPLSLVTGTVRWTGQTHSTSPSCSSNRLYETV